MSRILKTNSPRPSHAALSAAESSDHCSGRCLSDLDQDGLLTLAAYMAAADRQIPNLIATRTPEVQAHEVPPYVAPLKLMEACR